MMMKMDLQYQVRQLENQIAQARDENIRLRLLADSLQSELQALQWKYNALKADANERFRIRYIAMD